MRLLNSSIRAFVKVLYGCLLAVVGLRGVMSNLDGNCGVQLNGSAPLAEILAGSDLADLELVLKITKYLASILHFHEVVNFMF